MHIKGVLTQLKNHNGRTVSMVNILSESNTRKSTITGWSW